MKTLRTPAAALALLLATAAAAAPPSAATIAANDALAATLDFDDRQDFEFASRGLVAQRADPIIRDPQGRVLRDFNEDKAFTGPAPQTVNPSLWRNATLVARHGLFKVMDGIWQVRGFDLSIMTIIKGETGWILVDPLTTEETAKAALALANETLGARPVVAVIYTHSHADHFGGGRGVIDPAALAAGKVRIFAPQGFMENAVAENVIAGPAMTRRADYMFGMALEHSPAAHVSAGLGPVRAGGTVTLVPPNEIVTPETLARRIDGVRFEFQLTPETEAPAEMNFYLPDLRALCMAENANGSMHNVLTPRGALVRDTRRWAAELLAARRMYAGKSDVMFTSHFWPRWGSAEIDRHLLLHAQAYAFVHNESVRLMNDGMNAAEIAETIKLPAALGRAWFNRGNYGSLKFNARAVYQRYMGGFDGDPVSLDPLPRDELARRYVAAMGGSRKAMKLAATAAAKGEDRWAATLLGHVVRAAPADAGAREALARSFEQLAYQAEAAPWRNFYLSGALELRTGVQASRTPGAMAIGANLQVSELLDTMSVRVVPERAQGAPFSVAFAIPDTGERFLASVGNGVMIYEKVAASAADATLVVPRLALIGMVGGQVKPADLLARGVLRIEGDPAVLQRFLGVFTPPQPGFPLVTPLDSLANK